MQKENILDDEKVYIDLSLVYKDKKAEKYDFICYETDYGTYAGVILHIGVRKDEDGCPITMLIFHLDRTWALVDIKDIRAIHEVINMISR